MIQAAVNGTRNKSEHPLIPQSPKELAEDAKQIFKAGADSMHFHVYDDEGKESLSPQFVSNSIAEIRKVCPSLPLGISTGEWIVPDVNERINLIDSWKVIPDFASVNMNENGAIEISKLLISKGIKIEAGISDLIETDVLLKSDIESNCIRILIELVEDSVDEALKTLKQIEKLLDVSYNNIPRLLHGFNSTVWDLTKTAFRKGYDTRIGFEDTLYLSDGNIAKNNSELIFNALKLKSELIIN